MDSLLKTLKKHRKIKNFRIYKVEVQSVSFGMIGTQRGGPYHPLEYTRQVSGNLHIEWSNGDVSLTNLTRQALLQPRSIISQAQRARFADPYRRNFVSPYTPSQKKNQYAQQVQEIIDTKSDILVQELDKAHRLERSLGTKKHELSLAATATEVKVINSKGLDISQNLTQYSLGSNIENKLAYDIESRTFQSVTTYKKAFHFLKELYTAASQPAPITTFQTKQPCVILSPEFTWELFDHFLWSNLSGSLVANDMSRFKQTDFGSGKKQLPTYITLMVDPLQTLTPGARNFTAEGVENKATAFIKQGKLISPSLDLKHAQKLDMPPTPSINSPYTTTFLTQPEKVQPLEQYIRTVKEGVFIPYGLGLHTQNQITGDYSLPAPYALYIKDGKCIGALKIIIIGNLCKDMQQDVDFLQYDFFPLPGMCYTPKISIT